MLGNSLIHCLALCSNRDLIHKFKGIFFSSCNQGTSPECIVNHISLEAIDLTTKVLTVVCVKINDNIQISDLFQSHLSLFFFCSTSCGSTHYPKSKDVPKK